MHASVLYELVIKLIDFITNFTYSYYTYYGVFQYPWNILFFFYQISKFMTKKIKY